MDFEFILILCTLTSMLISAVCFPFALRFALKHNIVDNPDARKLQKTPIPVFGGIAVVLGMLIPLMVMQVCIHSYGFWTVSAAILIIWMIGVTDDIRGLGALIRLVAEMILIWLIIWKPYGTENGALIDNFYGLFGLNDISIFLALPLSLIAGAGIVNSINLIDGVDGYSSGYGIIANTLFAVIFGTIGNQALCLFSTIAAAALVPFYMHNVFGQKSKMFIGDGGSLAIGFVMAFDVLTLLSSSESANRLYEQNIGIAALALAILCIPVFDTLRVMVARLLTGKSAFEPDKTHLHHLYIDMGFSHAGTSTSILLLNLLIVGCWYLSYRVGFSITAQFIVVVCMGLSVCAMYYILRACEKANNRLWQFARRIGAWTHHEQNGLWLTLQKLVDYGY